MVGHALCDEHLAKAATRKRARDRAVHGRDDVAGWRALYDKRWDRVSKLYLQRHCHCVDCLELGVIEPAVEVDHIVPHRGDRKLFWDRSNWQPLCHRCHARKTAREVLHSK